MRSLALSVLLVSFSSMASCPDLSGTYSQCTSSSTGEISNGSTVTQATTNGITTYTVVSMDEETGTEMSEDIVADSKSRTVSQTDEASGMVINVTTKASCMGNALMYEGSVVASGQTFANFVSHMTKNGTQMSSHTTGTSMGETINDTVICE